MAKVKIVQIAMALSTDEYQAEYLDDKGRVWYQWSRQKSDGANGQPYTEYYWQQLDLPDEPEA